MTLLDPDLVGLVRRDPRLDNEARVHVLATYLILQEGGPLANALLADAEAIPALLSAPVDDDEVLDHVEHRRAFLQTTLAWSAVEQLLEES